MPLNKHSYWPAISLGSFYSAFQESKFEQKSVHVIKFSKLTNRNLARSHDQACRLHFICKKPEKHCKRMHNTTKQMSQLRDVTLLMQFTFYFFILWMKEPLQKVSFVLWQYSVLLYMAPEIQLYLHPRYTAKK